MATDDYPFEETLSADIEELDTLLEAETDNPSSTILIYSNNASPIASPNLSSTLPLSLFSSNPLLTVE